MKLTSMVVFLCTYHCKPLGGRGLWARGRDLTKEQKFWSKDGTAYVPHPGAKYQAMHIPFNNL